MAGNRTCDGIRLSRIVSLAQSYGIAVRRATKHAYALNHPGMRPCPLGASTHAERMVAPWLARATGQTRQEAYQALRST